jgi:phosphate uptake regulator
MKHILSSFDGALYDLKNDILMMSTLTDRMFQNAITALLDRNTELCEQVEADDELSVQESDLQEAWRLCLGHIIRCSSDTITSVIRCRARAIRSPNSRIDGENRATKFSGSSSNAIRRLTISMRC